jgi:hypothetical protein
VYGMSFADLRQISIAPIIVGSDSRLPIFFISLLSREKRFLSASRDLGFTAPHEEIRIGIVSTCVS